MSRGVGDLNAGGEWAEHVSAMVAAASSHYPERAGDIFKYGSKLCTPAALARFDQLNASERARALHNLAAYRSKLLSGNVGPGSWDQMMGPDERIRQQARARWKRFRERRALEAAVDGASATQVAHRPDSTDYVARPDQLPRPRLLLPSQPRARFPTPDYDVAHSPRFGDGLHNVLGPHIAAPHAQVDYPPQQASRTHPRHDYLHDPTIFCPSCDPFDEPPPFVQPTPTVYHPQQREQGELAPHVLYAPFGEGDGHEQRRHSGQ